MTWKRKLPPAWTTRSNTIPAGLSNAGAISLSGSHNLAMTRDGAVVGWGYTSPVGSFAANGYGLNDMAGSHNRLNPPMITTCPTTG